MAKEDPMPTKREKAKTTKLCSPTFFFFLTYGITRLAVEFKHPRYTETCQSSNTRRHRARGKAE